MNFKSIFATVATVAMLAFSFGANAQENNNRNADGKVVRGAYETNPFFSNWYVQGGVGVNGTLDNIFPLFNADTQKGAGFAGEVAVGKWLTPEFGTRLGVLGSKSKFEGVDYNYHFVHGDFMWNLSNQIWGYKETRVYNLVPYLSAGLVKTTYGRDFAAGVGVLNNFRLSKHFDLNLDLRAVTAKGALINNAPGAFVAPSATVGVTYRFGKKTGWTRSVSTVAAAVAPLNAKIAALEAANAALTNDKDGLTKKVSDLEGRQPQTVTVEKPVYVVKSAGMTVTFDMGSATLKAVETEKLKSFATGVDKDAEVKVVGSADLGTGTKAINQKLAEKRAAVVASTLKDLGISNVETVVEFDTFELPAASRAAIIIVK